MVYKGNKVVISIDPGFGGTGICMFVNKELYRFSNIKSGKKSTERYVEIACKCSQNAIAWLSDLTSSATCREESYISYVDIVIESPHAMGGVKGNASLARGDVFKVAKLAGAIGVTLYMYIQNYLDTQYCVFKASEAAYQLALYYPDVRVWKGQVSKETTKRRVLRDVKYAYKFIKDPRYKLKPEYPDHVFDAAGIGLWFIHKTIMGVN